MSILVSLFFLLIIFSISSIKVVKQSEVFIIERLGKYDRTLLPGLNIIYPIIDRIRAKVNLSQQTIKIPNQGIITKDDKTITAALVIFLHITDPVKAVYEVESVQRGIQQITITGIRDIIGKINANSVPNSKESIALQLHGILDLATDKWGCKVDRVEITNISLSNTIFNATEEQTYKTNIELDESFSTPTEPVITDFNNNTEEQIANNNPITRY